MSVASRTIGLVKLVVVKKEKVQMAVNGQRVGKGRHMRGLTVNCSSAKIAEILYYYQCVKVSSAGQNPP
jgi:hypothetical protein